MGVTTEYDKIIGTIVAHRRVSSKGVPSHFEYLVKWQGLPESEASWEKEGHLWQFSDKVSEYWQKACDEGVASISGGGCHGEKLTHKFRDTNVPIPLACPSRDRENTSRSQQEGLCVCRTPPARTAQKRPIKSCAHKGNEWEKDASTLVNHTLDS